MKTTILIFLWTIFTLWAINIIVLFLGYDIVFFTMQSLKWFELPGHLWLAHVCAVSGILAMAIAILISTLSADDSEPLDSKNEISTAGV